MAYEIRTLGVGGILDSTFRLFRDHFTFIAIVAGVLYFPVSLAFELTMAILSPETYVPGTKHHAEALTPGMTPAEVVDAINNVVSFVLGGVLQGAIAYGIAQRILGRVVSPGAAIRLSLRRLFGIARLNILYYLGVLGGCVLFIVPGLILALMWYVAIPIYMLEDLPIIKILSRSARLMQGQKGKAMVLGFLMLVLLIASSAVLIPAIPNPYALAVVSAAVRSLLGSLCAVVATVMYFSARCANESYDLEILATSVEAPEPEETPTLL